jgi:hypothetical protein
MSIIAINEKCNIAVTAELILAVQIHPHKLWPSSGSIALKHLKIGTFAP